MSDDNRKIELIEEAVEYLLGAELLPENGWTQHDINLLEEILISEIIVKKPNNQ